jgi:hypothetical protein
MGLPAFACKTHLRSSDKRSIRAGHKHTESQCSFQQRYAGRHGVFSSSVNVAVGTWARGLIRRHGPRTQIDAHARFWMQQRTVLLRDALAGPPARNDVFLLLLLLLLLRAAACSRVCVLGTHAPCGIVGPAQAGEGNEKKVNRRESVPIRRRGSKLSASP